MLAICGKSNCGKDSVVNELVNNHGYQRIVKYTTRPKRPNETDGIEYYFISKEKFFKMISNNEFETTESYNVTSGTWYYGITKKSLIETNIKSIIILSPSELKKLKNKNIYIVQVFCEDETRRQRAYSRGDHKEEVERRFKADDSDFFTVSNFVDFFAYNDERPCSETAKDIHLKYSARTTLYIEIDNVILNTLKTQCRLYNKDCQYHEDYKKLNWWELDNNLSKLSYKKRRILGFYKSSYSFFDEPELIDWVKEILPKFYQMFDDVYFVEIGTKDTINNYRNFFQHEIFGHYIGFTDSSELTSLDGSFFISTNYGHLKQANCIYKVHFREQENNKIINKYNSLTKYNREIIECANWNDLYRYISKEIN